MIKKLTAIIMMAVLVCSLAACGGQTNKNDGNENETTTSGTQNEGKNKYMIVIPKQHLFCFIFCKT